MPGYPSSNLRNISLNCLRKSSNHREPPAAAGGVVHPESLMLPIIAIVGRPNVGKSRLFNRLVGRGKAIVADIPGVTRDRHYAEGEWCGKKFIVVDTGGLDLDPDADLGRHITKQSLIAVSEADLIICLFDARNDPTAADRSVVEKLRQSEKPVLFAVNKVDEPEDRDLGMAYYELGVDEIAAISAEHGIGVDDLLDRVFEKLSPDNWQEREKGDALTIAVVGKPNVGKSTLINRLAGEERVVAHEMAGTTRDAIDVEIEFDGKKYVFIDTAGVKRRWGVSDRLEKFTAMRSLRTVNRADIVLQLIDAADGLTKQDINLTGFVREEGKGCVLLVNKWDLAEVEWKLYEERLRKGLGDMHDLSILPISAMSGTNCLKLFRKIDEIQEALSTEISTSKLNDIIQEALDNHHLPVFRGKQVRIYYATQTGKNPPTFALFSNYPAAVPYSYRRYLTKKIMAALGVEGIPVKIVCRKK